jgi:hypothetical protein
LLPLLLHYQGDCHDFQLSEIAAYPAGPRGICSDDVTLDLGAVYDVGAVQIEVYANHVRYALLSTSIDGVDWRHEKNISFDPSDWLIEDAQEFDPAKRAARYVKWSIANDFKITVLDVVVFGMPRSASSTACYNDCSGHGACSGGVCACATGYDGLDCSAVSCTPTDCS